MADIAKITLIFVLIVLLLRKKIPVGYVLIFASVLLAALYLMHPMKVFHTARRALTGAVTIKLAIALTSIRVFELILREKNILSSMTKASKALIRRRKAVIVSMPLLIGLLPSIGGAYFSAPMVDESTKGARMSNEEKGFINYWFRHPWEYVLPLYPGIVLASVLSGLGIRTLIFANLPYAAMICLTGFLFSMREIGGEHLKTPGVSGRGLLSFTPIMGVLMLVMLFHMELHYALVILVAGLFLFYGYSHKEMVRAIGYGLSSEVIALIAGVMLFKETMESSGAVGNMSGYFTEMGIPLMPMLFLLPFASGLLTGITVGFVGATFPLLLSFTGEASAGAVSFAFASGFLGVLLSPVHVCLILTREYFKADMWGMYKRMIPASLIVFIVAAIEYFILTKL
jgi:integral membrane protein (TIGR00529 family)